MSEIEVATPTLYVESWGGSIEHPGAPGYGRANFCLQAHFCLYRITRLLLLHRNLKH